MLLASLGTSIANVGLPTLTRAFHASFQEVQWVVLAYLLASTTMIVSVGRLGDITGRRRLMLIGIVLFTVASVLCGVAPTLGLLIAARAVQGLGAAIMMALTMAFVGETVPKAQTGRTMGLLGTTSAIGTALGPSLGGILIHAFGWRAMFLVNVPLGLLTFALASRHLPVDRPAPKTERPESGSLATVLLAVFKEPARRAGLVMNALVSTVMMATLVVGPFHLSRKLGLEPVFVGLVMSVGPIVAALTGVLSGRGVDRFGAQRTTTAGLVAMAAGCFVLAMMPAALGVPGYIAPIVVVTVGYSLFQTANNTAVMAEVPPDRRGVISALLNLSRNLGLISGASVMGAVFTLSGMRGTFVVAAILVVGALAIVTGLKGPRWKFIS
jgi:MFS family permease